MTCSLGELSYSHNIKDYKLEFNKVSHAVPITEWSPLQQSVAIHLFCTEEKRHSDGAPETGSWVCKSAWGFLTHYSAGTTYPSPPSAPRTAIATEHYFIWQD